MVNFITNLLLVTINNAILVVYNMFSKITHFVVTIEKTVVEVLVKPFRDNV